MSDLLIPKISITIGWILVIILLLTGTGFQSLGTVLLTIFSTIFLFYVLVREPDKRSSIFGKILIFGGVLGLVTLYVNQGRDIATLEASVRTFATVTGLYLERISPHKKLKKFMFLAISTKVEFIGVTALTTLLANYGTNQVLPVNYWYLLVVLMAISVPLLAFKKLTAYRALVWTTTLISLVFLTDLVFSNANTYLFGIGIAVVLWPAITARVLGRKVFF